MVSTSFKGDQELSNTLEKTAHTNIYKGVAKRNGSSLQKMAQWEITFTKGYSAGATKRSIKLELRTSDLEVRIKATTDHSGYLKVGIWKMEAQPFVQPAFNEM